MVAAAGQPPFVAEEGTTGNYPRAEPEGQGPPVLHVSGAGWGKANGIYLPIAEQEGAMVYENCNHFVLSRERHAGRRGGRHKRLGWVLGVARQPLYAVQTRAVEPPMAGWRAVEGWGREPLPVIQRAGDVTEAVLVAVHGQLPRAEESLMNEDWAEASGIWREALEQLARLLDAGDARVAELRLRIHAELGRLPVRRARAIHRDAERACRRGDWEVAEQFCEEAHALLAKASPQVEDSEVSALRDELRLLREAIPQQRLEQVQAEARAALEAGSWEVAETAADMAKYLAAEGRKAGFATQEAENEAQGMWRTALTRRAEEMRHQGDEIAARIADGSWQAATRMHAEADRQYAEALQTLAAIGAPGDAAEDRQRHEAEVHVARGATAAALVDRLVDEAGEATAQDAWDEVDHRLEAAQCALRPAQGDHVAGAQAKLQVALRAAAEKKIATVQKLGEDAAKNEDWSEANACWGEALQILDSSASLREAAKDLRQTLVEARDWAACEAAGGLMRRGDACVAEGNIFDADDIYTEAIQTLAPHSDGVDGLRCMLHLKRAEVLEKKWQHKEAIDDCDLVVKRSECTEERSGAYILAAGASRAAHRQLAEQIGEPEAYWHFWMERACQYLEGAAKLAPDEHELQRQLRFWRREMPKRPQPIPMPPFDWASLPKNAKASYYGCTDRRAGFSDREISDIWSVLKKEAKEVTGPEDPEFCGYDERTALPIQPYPRHIGRRAFYRAVQHFSGDIGEEEFEAVWRDADQDKDGLLSFEEFERIMHFDDRVDRLAAGTTVAAGPRADADNTADDLF